MRQQMCGGQNNAPFFKKKSPFFLYPEPGNILYYMAKGMLQK